jgi:hypothetical protein
MVALFLFATTHLLLILFRFSYHYSFHSLKYPPCLTSPIPTWFWSLSCSPFVQVSPVMYLSHLFPITLTSIPLLWCFLFPTCPSNSICNSWESELKDCHCWPYSSWSSAINTVLQSVCKGSWMVWT